jgi:hypothetical protein
MLDGTGAFLRDDVETDGNAWPRYDQLVTSVVQVCNCGSALGNFSIRTSENNDVAAPSVALH